MNITIFLLCYNEELLLPFALKHYRDRFPTAKFVPICHLTVVVALKLIAPAAVVPLSLLVNVIIGVACETFNMLTGDGVPIPKLPDASSVIA
jgi:phosphotransferase system  glucose/maltose/N-acetylglucosamine-specific IIC component